MKCESCGIEMEEHLGLKGTCKELQEAKKKIQHYEEILRLIAEDDSGGQIFAFWGTTIQDFAKLAFKQSIITIPLQESDQDCTTPEQCEENDSQSESSESSGHKL